MQSALYPSAGQSFAHLFCLGAGGNGDLRAPPRDGDPRTERRKTRRLRDGSSLRKFYRKRAAVGIARGGRVHRLARVYNADICLFRAGPVLISKESNGKAWRCGRGGGGCGSGPPGAAVGQHF